MVRNKKNESGVSSPRVGRRAKVTGAKNDDYKHVQTVLNEPMKRSERIKQRLEKSISSPQNQRKRNAKTITTIQSKKHKTAKKDIEQGKSYCWICHKICEGQVCVCKRVYHDTCLKNFSKAFENEKCPECQLISINGTELTRPFIKSLGVYLESAIKWIRAEHKKKKQCWSTNIDDVFDIEALLKKVQDNTFKTTVEFFSELKGYYHNSCIIYGENSGQSKDIKKMLKIFREELFDMEACPSCYYELICNEERNFVKLCDPPHDIVWAKVHGHPHWPAKVLKVIDERARVRFFGSYEKSDIYITTIFHMSEYHPSSKEKNISSSSERTSLEYIYAVKEMLNYIKLFETHIGPFQYHKKRAFYEPKGKDSSVKSVLKKSNAVRGQNTNPQIDIGNSSSEHPSTVLPQSVQLIEPTISSVLPSEAMKTTTLNSADDSLINMSFCVDNPPPANNLPTTSIPHFTAPMDRNISSPINFPLGVPRNLENRGNDNSPSTDLNRPSTSKMPSSFMDPLSTSSIQNIRIKQEVDDPENLDSVLAMNILKACIPQSVDRENPLFHMYMDRFRRRIESDCPYSTSQTSQNVFNHLLSPVMARQVIKQEVMSAEKDVMVVDITGDEEITFNVRKQIPPPTIEQTYSLFYRKVSRAAKDMVDTLLSQRAAAPIDILTLKLHEIQQNHNEEIKSLKAEIETLKAKEK